MIFNCNTEAYPAGSDSEDDVFEDMATMLSIKPITKDKLRKIPRTNTYANSVNA